MKKLMNNPSDFVGESLKGILAAHADVYTSCPEFVQGIYWKKSPQKGKVSIVTGGGYGHLPTFLGYVGDGLCDGVAVGNVFTSPSCACIEQVSRAVDSGAGILYLFGNYTGDGMNFSMAKDLLEMDGIRAEILTASDDMASAPRENWTDRRGIAGIALAYKIAGSCAQEGMDLDEIVRTTKKALSQISTFGFSFSSCTLPDVGKEIFEIGNNEMAWGMGIHGEPGIRFSPLKTSREIASELTDSLLSDLSIQSGDEVAVLVNSLGATSREELYIFYQDTENFLRERGISVHRAFVGEYVTSLEMSGASLTLMKLDDELRHHLDTPAHSPFVHF